MLGRVSFTKKSYYDFLNKIEFTEKGQWPFNHHRCENAVGSLSVLYAPRPPPSRFKVEPWWRLGAKPPEKLWDLGLKNNKMGKLGFRIKNFLLSKIQF